MFPKHCLETKSSFVFKFLAEEDGGRKYLKVAKLLVY